MIKKVALNVFIFFVAVFFVIYFYFQARNVFIDKLETEYSTYVTIDDVIKLNCYIIREETLVDTDVKGIYNYVVSEGEKLGKGQVITNVYSTDSELHIQEQIKEINSKIAILEDSSVERNYFTLNVNNIDKDITSTIAEYKREILDGNLNVAVQRKKEFLTTLNKRYLVVNALKGFDDIIERYKNEKEVLTLRSSGNIGQVFAPASGYFFTNVDGYEGILTPELLRGSVNDIINAVNSKPETTSASTVGKIVSEFEWYSVCIVDKETAVRLDTNSYYNVSYPYSVGQVVRSKLINKIVQPDLDKVVLVFMSDSNYRSFNFIRNQVAEISLATYQGLKIKKEALRIHNGEEGVFVLEGNTVVFKRANKIYENDGYYIIDSNDPLKEENTTTSYLDMYDSVITNGIDLYDGKIIG